MLRTFVAVRIPPTPGLRRLHEKLSELGGKFRPAALGRLHVTLKFLGDTPQDKVSQIGATVKRLVECRPAAKVRLAGLGAFPNERRPSVVWVGLEDADVLIQIAADLERELAELGFDPEARAFRPHLTLLRLKARPPEALFALLSREAHADFGAITIDQVELLQSELARDGARHTPIATYRLAAER
ncbi:MAG TPA: RNA 2',3'-cyclic phosphodiesterase [Planctomycetaceae bacterium]|nr:RNA 2',3'-cyclic phosphodiesterase [Planctomycetaceae bacterium]